MDMTPQAFQHFKLSTLESNTLFEMSICRKTNRFLEFYQNAYLVLLIKQHTCKVSTLRLHKQKKNFELFQFFTSSSTSLLFGNRSQRSVSLTLQDKPEHTEMACILSWTSGKETAEEKLQFYKEKD